MNLLLFVFYNHQPFNMKPHLTQKLEILLLFILPPILLSIKSIEPWVKLSFTSVAIIYLIILSIKHRKIIFKNRKQIIPHQFWPKVAINLLLIFIASYFYIHYKQPDLLFKSVIEQPLVWLQFLMIYSFISVVPQEYIYRVFFFYRYQDLSKNSQIFYIINALLFSLAHLFFLNWFVLIFTFIGGYIFAYTYSKTKSWFWVSIEHAIYGGWLFTLGLGKILGFPI